MMPRERKTRLDCCCRRFHDSRTLLDRLVEGERDSPFSLDNNNNGSSTGPPSLLHRLSTRGLLFHPLSSSPWAATTYSILRCTYLGLMYLVRSGSWYYRYSGPRHIHQGCQPCTGDPRGCLPASFFSVLLAHMRMPPAQRHR